MKKILSLAVAVAFVLTATAVFAADQNTAANAVKAPTAEKVVAKTVTDPKVECLKKYPGKTEKDAEVTKCVADAKANVTAPAAKGTETAKATTATEKKVKEEAKATTPTTTPVKK